MKYDCLIVDDEEALAQSTCEYFNLFEIKSYWTASAAECLNFLQQNETELILLDINLGNASGFELCKRLRRNRKRKDRIRWISKWWTTRRLLLVQL